MSEIIVLVREGHETRVISEEGIIGKAFQFEDSEKWGYALMNDATLGIVSLEYGLDRNEAEGELMITLLKEDE